MGQKKYEYYNCSRNEELQKTFKERAVDMMRTLVQLYANQENLKITYNIRKKDTKRKGKIFTTS